MRVGWKCGEQQISRSFGRGPKLVLMYKKGDRNRPENY